jgi:AcrR family transcriptional regulator
VHRTTFYKHYQDKAALLERGTGQLLDALVSDSDHLPPSAYSVAQPPPYFVRLFEEAGKQQTFFRLLVCGDGVGHFQQMLRERIAEMATANVPAVPQPGLSADVAVAMHAHYVAGATVSLLAWWLEQGMPLSPRQMAQYLAAPHGHAPAPA